jgi:nucleoside-diphosphate-sugar epimerase
MAHTLVTGGNGFLGRAIVEQLLARGDAVRVIGRNEYPELLALGVECFVCDLATTAPPVAALRGVDVIYHAAAKAGIWGKGDDFYQNNVTATQRLVRAAVRAEVQKLIFTSTPSVVIGEEDIEGGDESLPYPERYLAPYPWTKALAERYVLAQSDLLTTAIRPHLIWGPRDPHILPRLIQRAKSGRLRRIGDGTNQVDVTYIDNAAEAHLLAADALSAESPLRGRAYFIGQETPVNLWDFINTLLARAGLAPVTKTLSYARAMGLATFLERSYRTLRLGGEPPLTRLVVSEMTHSHWFDQSAARRDFGYGPRISIEEGLQRTFAESETAE